MQQDLRLYIQRTLLIAIILIPAIYMAAKSSILSRRTPGEEAVISSSDPGDKDAARTASTIQDFIRWCSVYPIADQRCFPMKRVMEKDEFGREIENFVFSKVLDEGVLRSGDDVTGKARKTIPLNYHGHLVYGTFIEIRAHLQDREHERYLDACSVLSYISDVEFDRVWDYAESSCSADQTQRRWNLGS